MNTQFGSIRIIPGEGGSRFPYCTSLFIDDDVKVLIDPGAGLKALNALKQDAFVDIVVNTHCHYDHIFCNHLFEGSRIIINEKEARCFRDRRFLGMNLGMEEVYGRAWVDSWIERIADPSTTKSPYSPQNSHNWWLSTARLDGEYRWGEVMDFGKTKMHVIGAPGHSAGFNCLYFPEHGAMYVADIDLTSFGPWYGGSDGDIDLFISSCEKIMSLECRFYITGHEKGVLGRQDFIFGLKKFIKVIDDRDNRILSLLAKPLSMKEIVDKGPIYGRKYHIDDWVYMWEYLMVKKHILRMAERGQILDLGGTYAASVAHIHHM